MMKKLTKLIKSFNQTLYIMNHGLGELQNDFAVLQPLLPVLFPDNPTWDSKQKPYYNLYAVENLPFHTRDEGWLIRYVARAAKEQGIDIPMGKIEKYVQISSKFDAARLEYEQNLVKCRIVELQDNPRSNVLFTKDEPISNFVEDTNYDKLFRTDVVISLDNLGLPRHSIESGLEKYAHLWREAAMRRTFDNIYYPATLKPRDPYYCEKQQSWQDNKQKHQDFWLRLREYEYYQDHKKIIDELAIATDNMKLKPAEVNVLTRKCKYYHDYHQILFTLPQRQESHIVGKSMLQKRRHRQRTGMLITKNDECSTESLRR